MLCPVLRNFLGVTVNIYTHVSENPFSGNINCPQTTGCNHHLVWFCYSVVFKARGHVKIWCVCVSSVWVIWESQIWWRNVGYRFNGKSMVCWVKFSEDTLLALPANQQTVNRKSRGKINTNSACWWGGKLTVWKSVEEMHSMLCRVEVLKWYPKTFHHVFSIKLSSRSLRMAEIYWLESSFSS